MVSLMAHFGHQDCLVKKIAQGNLFAEDCKARALNYVMEINANCLAYSAAIMGKAKQCRVIMVPNLSEAIPDYSSNDPGVHGGRSMSLGHLVSQNLIILFSKKKTKILKIHKFLQQFKLLKMLYKEIW